MKKLFVLAVLCCLAFASNAQINSIINRTSCPIKVDQVCYMPPACNKIINWTVVVPPAAIMPLPTPACPAPMETSYHVCWNAPGCMGICVDVAGQIPPPALVCIGFLPLSTPLPPCPACQPNNVTVTYDPVTGNLIIK
jgi:hypothetical protein